MTERRARPGIDGVALLAFIRETVGGMLLVIIRLMTGQTILVILWLKERRKIWRRRMARGAFQRFVRAQQPESIRRRRMVEDCILPGVDIVAFQTGRRETRARMLLIIIGLVARNTIVLIDGIEQGVEVRRWRMAR